MGRSVQCLLAAAILVSFPLTAWADWSRLRSPNFLFLSDASDRQLRDTARRLEQFRETMLRALPGSQASSPVPTIVLVFQKDASFSPFKPRFEGRTVDVSGLFLGAQDLNYLAVNIEHGEAGFSTVFHEYAHFLVSNRLGRVPVWVNEGIAQFYESFEDRESGRVAIIGSPIRDHVAVLRDSTLIPIEELITVTQDSPVYNEGSRRGVFYAESWALVHYLILGNKARRPQFVDYLDRLRRGETGAHAFQSAFQAAPATLHRELRDYVNQVRMTALRVTFDDQLGTVVPDHGEKITALEADVYLGDLQARLDRSEEARERLEKVLERQPGTARATRALGLMELRAGRLEPAVTLLERAATEGPEDGLVQAALGSALIARLSTLEEDAEQYAPTLERAHSVLARAVELDPELAHPSALLAYTELALGGDLKRATTLLARAVARAPAREDYRLMLARALLQGREFESARALSTALAANGSDSDVREEAQDLLRDISTAAQTASRSPRVASVPALRQVQAGETRVLGTLRGLVCQGERAVFVLQSEGRLLQLRQDPAKPAVLISYIPDPPASLVCGSLTPARRALVTYSAAADDVDGDVIAIELVPDDFSPR